MNIQQANAIPLARILETIGFQPARTSGHDLYYLSPIRNEKTASFHVNTLKNLWFDHGIGEGGDVVKLVCKYLERSNVDHTVADALRWLRNMMGKAVIIQSVPVPFIPKEDERKLTVTSVQEIERPALIRYLQSRGISLDVARRYYQQVDVYHKEKKTSIYALGMKNEKGGYSLRNKYYKGCAGPNDITFIRGTRPKPDGIHVFEGGPDFVTAVQRNNGVMFEDDAIVLHSVSNLKKATPFIKSYGYQTGFTWMHNDEAGQKATQNLHDFFQSEPDLTHRPMNALYQSHKDLNEFHMHHLHLIR